MILAKPDRTLSEHVDGMLRLCEHFDYCNELLRTAIIFHDVGKANDVMQRVLRGEHVIKMDYRHEILSAVIYLGFCDVLGIEPDDRITYAIITHHKSFGGDLFFELESLRRPRKIHDSFKGWADAVTQFLSRYYDFDADELTSTFKDRTRFSELCESLYEKIYTLKRLFDNRSINERRAMEFIVLKGRLQKLDHLDSAGVLPSDIPHPDSSVFNYFSRRGFTLNELQRQALNISRDDRVVVIASQTGSGKTETSLILHELWSNSEGGRFGKLFYVISNRASIRAIEARLREIYGEGSVSALYSASTIDRIIGAMNSGENVNIGEIRKSKEIAKKFATDIVVTTLYQLLKVTHGYNVREMYLADLCNAIIIFDEVHLHYNDNDYNRLRELVTFLYRNCPTRFVFVSATIPNDLINFIRNELGANIKLLTYFDNRECHNITYVDALIDSIEKIGDSIIVRFSNGEIRAFEPPLLVVVNDIETAKKVYEVARVSRKILLHSQFRYIDRAAKEDAIIRDYRNFDVIVTTQVVEVSVDIDCNSMITEIAPVPAIVQRLGRVNRRCSREPATVVVTDTARGRYVYGDRSIDVSTEIIRNVSGKLLTKRDEALLAEEYYRRCGTSVNIREEYIYTHPVDIIKAPYSPVVPNDETIEVILRDDFEHAESLSDLLVRLIPVRKGRARYKCDKKFGIKFNVTDCEYSNEIGLC